MHLETLFWEKRLTDFIRFLRGPSTQTILNLCPRQTSAYKGGCGYLYKLVLYLKSSATSFFGLVH